MSDHNDDIGRALTDHELMLVQGGGVWDKVENAGKWVRDQVSGALDHAEQLGQTRSVGAVVTVLNAVLEYLRQPPDRRNPNEVIH